MNRLTGFITRQLANRRYLLIVVTLITAAIVTTAELLEYYSYKRTLLKDKSEQVEKMFQSVLIHYRSLHRLTLEHILQRQNVGRHLYLAERGDLRNQHEILKRKVSGIYDTLKNHGVKQLHFHLKDNTSFLRMHRPDRYGDNLTGVRDTVAAANKEKKYVEGFEEGRIYNGFRFVSPLFYGDRHVGSVETSIAFVNIRERLNKMFDAHFKVIIDSSTVKEKVFANEIGNYRESSLAEGFFAENSEFSTKSIKDDYLTVSEKQAVIAAIRNDSSIQADLKERRQVAEEMSINDRPYILIFNPIENFTGEKIAYLITFFRSTHLAEARYSLYLTLFWALSALFLFGFLLHTYIRSEKMILEQSEKLAAANRNLEARVNDEIQKRIEKEQILTQQSRMAAMGEMIGVIAHQWRQPLNTLGLLIQDLEDAHEYNELEKEYIDRMVSSAMQQIDYMSTTIDDFRNFFKTSKKRVLFSVVEEVQKVINLIKPQLQAHGVNINWHTTPADAAVKVDGFVNEFKQVILNLLKNAQDAFIEAEMKQTAEIDISTEYDYENSGFILRIHDNGPGINPGVINRIFDPYFSTKNENLGTGIGLYMAKVIIEHNMDGSISVQNNEKGAVFTIKLPVKTAENNNV